MDFKKKYVKQNKRYKNILKMWQIENSETSEILEI